MQIQLKQAEIVEALKQYIAKQGIGLTDKHVVIGFTAGRKEAGITADISIEDADLPKIPVEAPKPVLSVVSSTTPEPIADVPEAAKLPQPVGEAPGESLFG